jgi:predicted enzyme related to lactoylglutathione lyase
MANRHGSFIWYELITSDAEGAERFYSDVVGWRVAPFGGGSGGDNSGGGMDYRVLHAGDEGIGGIMAMPPAAQAGGMPSGWYGYIGVDDVDEAARKIEAAGGAAHMPPQDIPGVGRMAFVADPQGVRFYVMRGSSEEPSEAFHESAVGHCSWNELETSDQEAGIDFYRDQFGFEPGDGMDMGPMGTYRFIHHGGQRIGAIMRQMKEAPRPQWFYYFRVPSVPAAIERIAAGGGQVVHGPQEVPGGDEIVIGRDPQGATFCLVAKK